MFQIPSSSASPDSCLSRRAAQTVLTSSVTNILQQVMPCVYLQSREQL